MKKRKRKGYETDREAGAGAQTASHPANVEEAVQAEQVQAAVSAPEGAETEDKPPVAFCPKCERPALLDSRKTHKCARCRSERI